MSDAYFVQKPGLAAVTVDTSELTGGRNKTIASLEVPVGGYVVSAKFTVAVGAGGDNDLRSRISEFGLAFAGKTEMTSCDLRQGGLDTVVLTIAGALSLSSAASVGGGPLRATARLYCISTSDDLEVGDVAMTAIPVDAIMSDAYFLQKAAVRVLTTQVAGPRDETIAGLEVPAGSYVVFAQLNVAVQADDDAVTGPQPRISRFGLAFAGKTDLSYCHLRQGGLDTVVLTIAGALSLSSAASVGGGPLRATARLYCIDTFKDLEIKHVALTAIPVDGIST